MTSWETNLKWKSKNDLILVHDCFFFLSGIYICIVVLIKILFRYWCISYDGHILTIVRENCNAISYSVHTSFQSLKIFVEIKLYGYSKY